MHKKGVRKMSILYNRIKEECEKRGKTVSAMCLDLGMSKSIMSDLKAGKKKTLSAKTLSSIADYLSVSVDFLLYGAEPEPQEVRDEDIKFALFGGDAEEITDEMFDEVKKFAQYVRAREKEKKEADSNK
jgi:transcriptional regulator with XRE-family HTH domain